jgi:ferric-dicitrate binding protein FerR (iron transport regulator)
MNPEEIMASLDAGLLDEHQAAGLVAALRDDADHRRRLAGEWRVHRTLPLLADTRAGERLVASLRLARPTRPTNRFTARVRERIDGRRRRWPTVLAAAAVLVAAIGLPLVLRDPALAIVVSTTGGRIANHIAQPGERVPANVELTGPMILAWTGEATRLELAADAALRLSTGSDGKRIALAQGAITAEVAPQPAASSLVVTAPIGHATVVGTRFTLTSRADRLGLNVASGHVRLTDRHGRAVDVTTGLAAEIRDGTAPSLVSGPDLDGRPLFRSDFTLGKDRWWAALATAITEDWTNADKCRWDPIPRVPDPLQPQAQTLRLSSDMPAQWFARQLQQPVRHPGVRLRLLVIGPLTGRRFFATVSDSEKHSHSVALDIRAADTWLTVTADWREARDPFPPGSIDSLYVGEELAVGAARTVRTLYLGEIELFELDDPAAP